MSATIPLPADETAGPLPPAAVLYFRAPLPDPDWAAIDAVLAGMGLDPSA